MAWDDILVRSLAATLQARFHSVLALPTSEPPNTLGSIVLVAADRKLKLPDGSLPDPVDYLSDPLGHWVVLQMDHAWANQYQPDTRGIRVLTDDWSPADQWGERINLAARRELHRYFGPHGSSW